MREWRHAQQHVRNHAEVVRYVQVPVQVVRGHVKVYVMAVVTVQYAQAAAAGVQVHARLPVQMIVQVHARLPVQMTVQVHVKTDAVAVRAVQAAV